MMDPLENLLRAIRFDEPEYVPRANEGLMGGVAYEGNFRIATWTDHWGVGWETTRGDMVPFPKSNPLRELERIADFEPPDPNALIDADMGLAERVEQTRDGGRRLVFGQQTYLLFERAWALCGMESFLAGILEAPELIRELLRKIADYNIAVFQRYAELGLDGIAFSEDLGSQRGLLLSPAHFREFLKPEYARMFAPVKQAGMMIDFHSCGCVQAILPDLVDVGVDILNPVQARANDLAEVKRLTHGRMALLGGIDTQQVLMRGTPQEVEDEVRRVLSILAPGGGFIIAPDQGMPFPPENIAAMWEAAEKWGRYPLAEDWRQDQ